MLRAKSFIPYLGLIPHHVSASTYPASPITHRNGKGEKV
jgi:hypothetical protein